MIIRHVPEYDGADPAVLGLEECKALRLAALAALRWEKQQTMMFNGVEMPADVETMSLCTSAEAYARNADVDPDAPRNWKIGNGRWTTLSINEAIAYGIAIGTHIQACFDREKELTVLVQSSSTRTVLDAVDLTADWPG
jgi:hypothetical protein